jgi:hypothetical protein
MMCGIAENRVPEWRATLAVCQNSWKNGPLMHVLGFFGVILRHGTFMFELGGILLTLR